MAGASWDAGSNTTRGDTMLRKILIAGAVTLGLTAPTLAAEFYVVQATATKKCTIVDKKPTVTTSVVVGDGKVYTTRTEAETGMKTVKVCTN
jgi:vancomycin permeability regulator SanA